MNKNEIDIVEMFKLNYSDINEAYFSHTHDFFQLIYIENAENSTISISQLEIPIETNTLYIIHPHTLHSFVKATDLSTIEIKIYILSPTLLDILKSLPTRIQFKDQALHDLLIDTLNELKNQSVLYKDFVIMNLIKLIYMLQRVTIQELFLREPIEKNESSYPIKNPMNKVINYIHENSNNKIYLIDLANTMHMEPTYFLKKFKATFNITPMKYLNKVRIHKSLNLLEYTNMSISEIAIIVGFENAKIYHAVFRKFFDQTPSEYRKKIQNELTKKIL